jgi:hypothetical protein
MPFLYPDKNSEKLWLIVSESRSSLTCTQASFRRSLTRSSLLSASILFLSHDSSGFSYRGLTPHKITTMPGVHNTLQLTALRAAGNRGAIMPIKSKNKEVM